MKNKKKNLNKRKLIILVVIVLIIILSIISGILENNKKQNNNDDNLAIVKYESIEQILNQYGCKLIKETKSSEKNYAKDLYVSFKYNTFEGTESKKRYYENIISLLADFIKESYRLIDKDKGLVIEVQKNEIETGKVVYIYAINGEQNYFEKQETKISVQNYKQNKETNLQVNSNILNTLMQNEWKANVNFGTKDSTFNKYDIYFDEGIEVRKISGKVYNIVFTNRYEEEIVNGIRVGTNFDEIIRRLGEPTFGNKNGQYIGYKSSNIYAFFLEDSISIYVNEKVEMKEFEELLNNYVENKIGIKEFMNDLTYLWPDYEEYTYNSSYIYINYPNKGIKIEMRKDSPIGIEIYNNCNITNSIEKLLKEGKISSKVKEDLNEYTLKNKINKEEEYTYLLYLNDGEETEETEETELSIHSSLFYIYTDLAENYINKVYFTSKVSEYPNRELNEKINQGFFANDNTYVYSIENKGIYTYDVISGNKNTIITGEETFELKEYDNGLLSYDEKQINLNLE